MSKIFSAKSKVFIKIKKKTNNYRYLLMPLILMYSISILNPAIVHADPNCTFIQASTKNFPLSHKLEADSISFIKSKNSKDKIVKDLNNPILDIDLSYPVQLINSSQTGGDGAFNFGVYRLKLKSGEFVAVKMTDGDAFESIKKDNGDFEDFTPDNLDHPKFVESMFIQKQLGSYGLSPKVYGYLTGNRYSDLQNIIKNAVEHKVFFPENSLAVIYEYVPGVWNLSKDGSVIPRFLYNWTDKELYNAMKKIKELQKFLNTIGVDGQDPQIFMNEDGKIMLGDLDLYSLASPNSDQNLNIFDDFALHLLNVWEASTEGHISKSELLDYLDIKKVSLHYKRVRAYQRKTSSNQ